MSLARLSTSWHQSVPAIPAPRGVTAGATDANGDTLTYSWDFDGNGTADATGATASTTFTTAGNKTVKLTVTDGKGGTATKDIPVQVLVDHSGIDRGRLLAGARVQLGAHPVEDLIDLERRVFGGALEQQMLQQVREPGLVVGLAARARSYPQPERDGADRGHRLGHDPRARFELCNPRGLLGGH